MGVKVGGPRGHCRVNRLVWEPGYLGTWLTFAINELGDLSKPPAPSCAHPTSVSPSIKWVQ